MRFERWIIAAMAIGVALALHLRSSSHPVEAPYAPPATVPGAEAEGGCGGKPGQSLCLTFTGGVTPAAGDAAVPADGRTDAGDGAALRAGWAALLTRADLLIGERPCEQPPVHPSLPSLRIRHAVGASAFDLAVIDGFVRPTRKGDAPAPSGPCAEPELHLATVAAHIQALKSEAPPPFVVVRPRWGRRHRWITEGQQALGRALIDAGADLVVGHGSGTLQEVERYEERWIVYGLGSPGGVVAAGAKPKIRALPLGAMLRLLVTERGGGLRQELRLYPTHAGPGGGRLLSLKEASDAYWQLLLRAKDYDKKLKAALRPGHDQHGRHLRLMIDG